MKPRFLTRRVTVGDYDYDAIVRVLPARAAARVGADSPRFLDPGAPARVQVIRIFKAAVDVTDDLTVFTRTKIEDAVRDSVK